MPLWCLPHSECVMLTTWIGSRRPDDQSHCQERGVTAWPSLEDSGHFSYWQQSRRQKTITSWAVLAAALIKHCNNIWWWHYSDLLKISKRASVSTNLKLPVSHNPCIFDFSLLSENERECIFYFSCIVHEFYLDTVDKWTLVWKW